MKINDIGQLLRGNAYPGRGIVMGTGGDGKNTVAMYFTMGRSEKTRSRLFKRTGDGITTAALDPKNFSDPDHLYLYTSVRVIGRRLIVSNGEQTDTIHDFLEDGRNFRAALNTWSFEPDAMLTPRISGLVEPDGHYTLSILKSLDGDSACCCRFFYEYSTPVPGAGHFITTYQHDAELPPSFAGEPVTVGIDLSNGLEAFARYIWDALDEGNKVSLYACEFNAESGIVRDLIINKYAV